MSDDSDLSAALAAATCALLGATVTAPVAAEEVDRWSFDTALLYYGESDDRVQDVSATIGARLRGAGPIFADGGIGESRDFSAGQVSAGRVGADGGADAGCLFCGGGWNETAWVVCGP